MGKLYLSSISNINKLDVDKKIFIARKSLPIETMKKYDLLWAVDFAPSAELFSDIKSKVINWKQYVKRYRKEMLNNKHLNFIEKALEKDISIAFICYCNGKNCHRYILGNYYKELGFEVIEI